MSLPPEIERCYQHMDENRNRPRGWRAEFSPKQAALFIAISLIAFSLPFITGVSAQWALPIAFVVAMLSFALSSLIAN